MLEVSTSITRKYTPCHSAHGIPAGTRNSIILQRAADPADSHIETGDPAWFYADIKIRLIALTSQTEPTVTLHLNMSPVSVISCVQQSYQMSYPSSRISGCRLLLQCPDNLSVRK